MSTIFTKFNSLTNYFKTDKAIGRYDSSQPKEILRTTNRTEYETKKLEKQQEKFFQAQWKKVSRHIHNKSLVYETQRYPSYLDYDLMEHYPIIGQALDILAEESTTTNAKGKVLNIYSESKRVQEALEDLFFNRLNIHTNIFMWTRNMVKNGDSFLYLSMDGDNGITGARQLPTIEVERLEVDGVNPMQSYLNYDENETVFRWKSLDIVEFKYYQIAHFRLLVDDRRLPYGVSVLEKARRIWKNLLLVEDAMRTLRLLRAIDRRAYYINVGNIDPADVEAFMDKITDRFKRTKQVDPYTGQEDLKFNVMGYDQDYFIPIRDKDEGTRIETIQGASNIADIADIEYDLNQLFAALGIPKPFLQFEDAAGEGKNLSMQDIRFARKINRIQQSVIMELNKIALVHLLLLGLEDEMSNFELSLNNPSIQSEIMRMDLLDKQINIFRNAVSDANGFGLSAMSVTKAKKEILGQTNNEIKLDFEQQYLERAAGAEIEKAPEVVSKTTLFDNIISLYGDESMGISKPSTEGTDGGGGDDLGGGGGGGGGGGLGGGDLGGSDISGEFDDADLGLDVEGGTEGDGGADTGTEEGAAETTEQPTEKVESHNKKKPLIIEKSKDVLFENAIEKMKKFIEKM